MNEQLLKLAKESGISLRGFPMNPQMIYPSELQKFSELIVRECMRMCDVAEASLLTHGVREQSYGAADARRFISDWFEVEE